jgi:hypothetical protein
MTEEEKLKRKIDGAKEKLGRDGRSDNPDDIVNWLVYFEVSRLSGKMSYLLGAIGVLIALILAIMLRG